MWLPNDGKLLVLVSRFDPAMRSSQTVVYCGRSLEIMTSTTCICLDVQCSLECRTAIISKQGHPEMHTVDGDTLVDVLRQIGWQPGPTSVSYLEARWRADSEMNITDTFPDHDTYNTTGIKLFFGSFQSYRLCFHRYTTILISY